MLQKLQSIKTKIIVLYLILLFITLVFAGFLLQNLLRDYFSNWLSSRLRKEVELVREVLPLLREVEDKERLNDLIDNYSERLDIRLTVIAADGEPLADSAKSPSEMDNHLHRPEVQQVLEGEMGEEVRYSSTTEEEMHYIALPISFEGKIVGIIRGAMSIEQLNQIYQGLWQGLFQIGIAAFLLSILLSIKFATQITEPIREMTVVAEKIANGFLDQELVIRTKDEIGKLGEMFNHMVTKVQEKIKQISSEKSKVEAIVSSINDGIIAVNNKQEIIMFNQAAEVMFGVEDNQVVGKPVMQIIRNHKLAELISYSLEKAETFTEEVELLLPEEKVFRVSLAPIEKKTEINGVVVSLRDITEMKDLQRMRTEFVSNVSHELKTPLTSIKGYVETLLNSKPEADIYQSFLEVIADEADRLERLINNTLDLSKIETERQLKKEKVDLKSVIEDIKPILKPRAKEQEVELKFELNDLPTISGDSDQLAQALINLIDNGLKYTSQGGWVKVKSYVEKEELIIIVEDNGIGIPESDLNRIFERFYRVDKARSREYGGTGLGLSIVKHIINRHYGKIEVESKMEVGTKFTIKLPV